MKFKNFFILVGIAVLIQGCAAPFSQFYYAQTGRVDITSDPRVIIATDTPKIFRGNNPEKDAQGMAENGYMMVGYSSFNAGNVNENGAISQAEKVNASVVLLYSKYTNTISGVMPLTLPDTQTSSTSLSGSAYGSGGYANYYGTATTTTYGTKTTYIPYSVNRADYLATYWVKLKPLVLGIQVQDLTPEIRKEIQSNKGVLTNAVMKGSPAFKADILKGDVLKRIGDVEIYDVNNFLKAVDGYAGQNVIITFFRNGREIQKEVQLNNKTN